MEPFAHVIKVSVPRYLAGLPIPDNFVGLFHLSLRDWLALTPFFGIIAGTTYLSFKALFSEKNFCSSSSSASQSHEEIMPQINPKIKKDSPKVVDTVDIEEIGDKKVFCRCWRSEKFPYCDGSHAKHNELTSDNVGPLIIQRSKKD